jgi:hypothetical protein
MKPACCRATPSLLYEIVPKYWLFVCDSAVSMLLLIHQA